MARVEIHDEVGTGEPDDWNLYFQRCTYHTTTVLLKMATALFRERRTGNFNRRGGKLGFQTPRR